MAFQPKSDGVERDMGGGTHSTRPAAPSFSFPGNLSRSTPDAAQSAAKDVNDDLEMG